MASSAVTSVRIISNLMRGLRTTYLMPAAISASIAPLDDTATISGLLINPVSTTATTPSPATRKYTISGPVQAYSTPPKAGAAKVMALIAPAFSASALVNCLLGTSWAVSTCRAGIAKEKSAP